MIPDFFENNKDHPEIHGEVYREVILKVRCRSQYKYNNKVSYKPSGHEEGEPSSPHKAVQTEEHQQNVGDIQIISNGFHDTYCKEQESF